MPSAPKVYRPQEDGPRQDHRPAAHKRGYDRDWRRLRDYHMNQHPLCEDCKQQGDTVAANMVDHVVPVDVDPSRRLDPSNLRSLCWKHHAVKTHSEHGRGVND
jgi:5-methylcytosine-specific restriction protein A